MNHFMERDVLVTMMSSTENEGGHIDMAIKPIGLNLINKIYENGCIYIKLSAGLLG